MSIVSDYEAKTGKRWNKWTQEERFELAKTIEDSDLIIPLLVNIIAEAYINGRGDTLRPSIQAMFRLGK